MTDREIMQQALESLKLIDDAMPFPVAKLAIKNLRERLAQPEQEPYAWMAIGGSIWRHKTTEDDVPLYTTPPRREWVGLTDEEFSYGIQMASNTSWMKAAKWLEAKLKEKNQ